MDARDITIRRDEQALTVTTLGAALRSYTVAGRAVLDGTGPGEPITGGRGQLLLPWPNRIADATYVFDGVRHELPVTEQSTGSASHGLVRKEVWDVVEERGDGVRLAFDLAPRPGYPFALRLEVDHALTADGLRVRVTATNTGGEPAPYAAGAHPYLTVGTDLVDDAVVQVPGSEYLRTDERSIPTGRAPVDGTPFDLREPQRLGSRRIDHAYTGLRRDGDGRVRVRMTAPDGWSVALWMGAAQEFLQVFTGDHLAEEDRRRRGLAVEPMTAPADAFNSGEGLAVLAPGEARVVEWGIETG